MLLAGSFSIVAGVAYVIAATAGDPRLNRLVIDAATGGAQFVGQAWLVSRRRRRLTHSGGRSLILN